jgi:hypothetical protein
MRSGNRKVVVLLLSFFLLCILLGFVISRPQPVEPLPSPNGHDDFVEAGRIVVRIDNWQSLPAAELRQLVASNEQCLRLVRIGLAKACLVPSNIENTNELSVLSGFKRIAEGFSAESHLSLLDSKTNEAVRTCVDCVRFGAKSGRGGLLIHRMMGVVIQTLSLSALEPLIESTDTITARESALNLEAAIVESEPVDMMLQRERSSSKNGGSILLSFVMGFVRPAQMRKPIATIRQADDANRARLQNDMLALAVRAFELDSGSRPLSVKDLVPKYLKSVPIDPATGSEMRVPRAL